MDETDFLSRIRTQYHNLTKSQRRIADYISEHGDEVLTNSITTLSRRIGTNPPALTRFFQAIHYKGFGEFKFLYEKALIAPLGSAQNVSHNDDVRTVINKLMTMHREALGDTFLLLDSHTVARAVDAICKAGKVHIFADGGPGASATFAYMLLLQIGVTCNYFTDRVLSIMGAGQLVKGDVAIGITYSGNSGTVVDALGIAAKCGATTIGITAHANSPLAKQADLPLCYSLKIADDLRYLHIARMCEIAIFGVIQSLVLNRTPPHLVKNLEFSKSAITFGRGSEERVTGKKDRKKKR